MTGCLAARPALYLLNAFARPAVPTSIGCQCRRTGCPTPRRLLNAFARPAVSWRGLRPSAVGTGAAAEVPA
jgi:hypothetical protein